MPTNEAVRPISLSPAADECVERFARWMSTSPDVMAGRLIELALSSEGLAPAVTPSPGWPA